MGNLGTGRNLVLCSIVTSERIKATVSNAVFANEISRRLTAAGIMPQGQPARIPTPLLVNTVSEEYTLGWTRVETDVSVYLNLSAPINSLQISDIVSQSWNRVTTLNSGGHDTNGVTADRPLGNDTCPPGSVFEVGTRAATLEWCARGHQVFGWIIGLSPTPESYYQVRTVHCPVSETGDVPRAGIGAVNSIFTSRVQDSSEPTMLNQSLSTFQPPTMQDVANAAHSAGEFVNRTVGETIGGAVGMNGTDIKVIAYASLGIVGALVFVKILKEVKAI